MKKIAIIFLLFAAAACNKTATVPNQNTTTTTDQATPSNTAANTPHQNGTSALTILNSYTSTQYHFSIQYPITYQAKANTDPSSDTKLTIFDPEFSDLIGVVNINISQQPILKNGKTYTNINELINGVFPGSEVNYIQFAGYKAASITASGTSIGSVVFLKDNLVYNIASYDTGKPEVQKIVDSFKFVTPGN